MQKFLLIIIGAALTVGGLCASARAEDEDLRATVEALKARVAELEGKADKTPDREQVKQIVSESIADNGPIELPDWLQDFILSADLRLRYQRDWDEDSKTRNRARYRLRVGVKKSWFDGQLVTGLRLASGDTSGATSTNETAGDYFAEDDLWIDLAYLTIKPKVTKGLMVTAGKVKNPYVMTNIIFDGDVTPEGVYGSYSPGFEVVNPFVGVGYFIIDENSTAHDVSLAGYQAGLDVVLGPVTWQTVGSYYYFEGYENSFPSAGGNTTDGTKLLAGNFHVYDVLNTVKFKIVKVPVKLQFDWLQNCHESDPTPGQQGLDTAYGAFVTVGQNKKKGDFSAKYKYAYIEANATPSAFSDGDFGGTNRKGHVVSAAYNVTDFMTVGANLINTAPIDGAGAGDDSWTGQIDVILKY